MQNQATQHNGDVNMCLFCSPVQKCETTAFFFTPHSCERERFSVDFLKSFSVWKTFYYMTQATQLCKLCKNITVVTWCHTLNESSVSNLCGTFLCVSFSKQRHFSQITKDWRHGIMWGTKILYPQCHVILRQPKWMRTKNSVNIFNIRATKLGQIETFFPCLPSRHIWS